MMPDDAQSHATQGAMRATGGHTGSGSDRADLVMDALKQRIIEERLQPGAKLPTEAELCRELGVSRSSVREALSKLAALDIVTSQRGKGTQVANMSLSPLVESLLLRSSARAGAGTGAVESVAQLREYLDLGMAEGVVRALSGTHHDNLHDIVARMTEKALRGENFQHEDIEFHIAMTSALDNEVALEMVTALWVVHSIALRDLDDDVDELLLETAQAHKRIIQAAEDGDIFAYRGAVIDHYRPLNMIIDRHEAAQQHANSGGSGGSAESTPGECGDPEAPPAALTAQAAAQQREAERAVRAERAADIAARAQRAASFADIADPTSRVSGVL
ncbi:MAG: GntR family transcriptional regulator [Actinotignum sanguinis]|uniref:FadR/GntR family transcriptional regulator n=1 Tax=Actinomycetaceae TaxID=2049 RepID=UPI00237DF559|nr:GntR family transcriptional regulator [Actinotignum sanguinis]MDK6787972.1 GntR family transcriptional regulator [Actinotignum timonense]MDE1553082.1 GntR family transcriptional regulator [Actinotignum sanguinis]MDE1565204.1 GntR family transcriptional regulator [Actinotignum sanguinis]MDK8286189.1 GntR family transcriptional regulator [Actinotignum sanguinis]MDK8651639.1 GntR family transcriptional regulator [Actinotignum sanguinis]